MTDSHFQKFLQISMKQAVLLSFPHPMSLGEVAECLSLVDALLDALVLILASEHRDEELDLEAVISA